MVVRAASAGCVGVEHKPRLVFFLVPKIHVKVVTVWFLIGSIKFSGADPVPVFRWPT